MTTNRDGPSDDDFAMKVYTRFMMTTVLTMNDPNAAAARVLSEAFDKVRAEERARMQSAAPDEVVEAVARTLCSASGAQWRERGNRTPEALAITDPDALNNHWRYKAKAALTAAIPAIKAQVLAEIVAWLRMGEHVHSRSGSIESERVFKLIADALERRDHETTA